MSDNYKILIGYIVFSILYQLITVARGWKGMKKKFATNPQISMVYAMLKASPATKDTVEKIFSPVTIGLVAILAICIMPVSFPVIVILDIFHLFKKDKSKDLADALDRSQKESEHFMKTEGRPPAPEEATTFQPPA